MIAIKDFKMPRGCYECPFADESIRMDCDYYCQAVKEKPDVQYGLNKPDWCPLVDVPDMNVGNCSEFPNNSDCVSRRAAVEAIANQSRFSAEEIINICDKSVQDENGWLGGLKEAILAVLELPSAQPERLTDDDFETIRIHLSAYKERLCNQRRWKEAEEYQRIINRFMNFASAQPEADLQADLQSTCNQLATERYEDLCEYFGNQRDPILTDRREFKRWLDRVKWHVKKVDELARRSEDEWCTDCPAYDHEKHHCPRFNRVIRKADHV